MTTSPTTTINSAYPPEVLKGGGAATKWISALKREELHLIVQDKQLPILLVGELVKNVPVKYLKNLVHHKKCTSELRITVLRRIYRAKQNEMKIPDRIQTYNSILKISDLSDKEKRITKSYIRELEQGNYSKDSSKPEKELKKHPKKSKRKKKVVRKQLPPVIIRDSTVSEVVNFLKMARKGLISESGIDSKILDSCRTKSAAMFSYSLRTFKSLAASSNYQIDMEDLLTFRMELNDGLHSRSKIGRNEEFFKDYEQSTRGEFARNFLLDVNMENNAPETIYMLLVKASSLSPADFASKISDFRLASRSFEEYLAGITPQLNYGQVETTLGGMAKISFSASLNFQFPEDSFKYWESTQDESFGFPIKFEVSFDRKTNLNNCKVTITNLLPGMCYKYEIKALNGHQVFKLSPREFKIPDPPEVVVSSGYVRGDYRDYGAPVPLGGGGERRFSQF
jgi:hypothetical protein